MPQTMSTHQPISKYPQSYHNMVSQIMNAAGAKKWRLAAAAYLHLNQVGEDGLSAREATRMVIEENRRHKQAHALVGNKFALSEGGSIRDALHMPAGMLAFIELFDPEVLSTKANLAKLMKAFPEFTKAEKV